MLLTLANNALMKRVKVTDAALVVFFPHGFKEKGAYSV